MLASKLYFGSQGYCVNWVNCDVKRIWNELRNELRNKFAGVSRVLWFTFVKFYPWKTASILNARHLQLSACWHLRRLLFFSIRLLLTSQNGWNDRMGDVTAGEWNTLRTRTRRMRDVSRRSSRQILFRKIGLPLSSTTERQQLYVASRRRGSSPTYQTHVTCVRAGASEKLSRLSPQSSSPPTFNLSLFSFARQTAIPHEYSIYLNHAKWCRPVMVSNRQTIGFRNPRLESHNAR